MYWLSYPYPVQCWFCPGLQIGLSQVCEYPPCPFGQGKEGIASMQENANKEEWSCKMESEKVLDLSEHCL